MPSTLPPSQVYEEEAELEKGVGGSGGRGVVEGGSRAPVRVFLPGAGTGALLPFTTQESGGALGRGVPWEPLVSYFLAERSIIFLGQQSCSLSCVYLCSRGKKTLERESSAARKDGKGAESLPQLGLAGCLLFPWVRRTLRKVLGLI